MSFSKHPLLAGWFLHTIMNSIPAGIICLQASCLFVFLCDVSAADVFSDVSDLEKPPLFMKPLETQIFGKPGDEKPEQRKEVVDFVLVRKQERKLYLFSGSERIRSYSIALGKRPKGHKKMEGDSRTPEGMYTLDWRNPNSKFFRSIHVSYPSPEQYKAAEKTGVNLGGAIMIHGQPSSWSERIKLTFARKDWTEGCIALENQDMLEVWNMVEDGTPISIEP